MTYYVMQICKSIIMFFILAKMKLFLKPSSSKNLKMCFIILFLQVLNMWMMVWFSLEGGRGKGDLPYKSAAVRGQC